MAAERRLVTAGPWEGRYCIPTQEKRGRLVKVMLYEDLTWPWPIGSDYLMPSDIAPAQAEQQVVL